MFIRGSLQQCFHGALQSLVAPSELIEGQLADPTEYIPETDETLLVYNPCKPTLSSAHCCGSQTHVIALAFVAQSPASRPSLPLGSTSSLLDCKLCLHDHSLRSGMPYHLRMCHEPFHCSSSDADQMPQTIAEAFGILKCK